MVRRMSKIVSHQDILGSEIFERSHVAFCRENNLILGAVIKVSPKLIRVMSISGYERKAYLVHPNQSILLQEADMIMYLLKHSGD